MDAVSGAVEAARAELEAADPADGEQYSKAEEQLRAAEVFCSFRQGFQPEFDRLAGAESETVCVPLNGGRYYGLLLGRGLPFPGAGSGVVHADVYAGILACSPSPAGAAADLCIQPDRQGNEEP